MIFAARPPGWRSRVLGWACPGVLAFAAGLIVLNTLFWAVRLWSPVPFLDQWETLIRFVDYRANGPSWDALWRQHVEHRLVFPRLIFLADFVWLGGRNLLPNVLIMVIQLAATATLFAGDGARQWNDRHTAVAVGAAVVAMMFSLNQHENFGWGFQVQFVGVYACAIGAYALLHRCATAQADGRAWAAPLAGAVGLLTVGVFTMANGVVAAWLAVVLAVMLGLARRPLLVLAGAVLLMTALFFIGYVSPTKPILYLAEAPGAGALFILSFLGNLAWNAWPGQGHQVLCLVVGAAGVALSAGGVWRALAGRDRGSFRLVYLTLILFVSATAVLIAGGRIGYGVEQALISRYTTPVALYWSAQLLYWRSVVADGGRRPWPISIAAAAAVTVAALGQGAVKPTLMEHNAALDVAGDALLTGVDDPYALERAYPHPNVIVGSREFMKRERLSVFASPEASWLGKSLAQIGPTALASRCSGAVDLAARPSLDLDDALIVAGWAWERSGRPARRVVLANATGQVVGLATVSTPRPDVPRAAASIYWLTTGWRGYARAQEGEALTAYVRLSDGALCPVGSPKVAPPRPAPVARPYSGPLGAPIPAAVAFQNGFGPAVGAFEVAAPAPTDAYASWMGEDTSTGEIRFGPFTPVTAEVVVQVATGPDTSGARIDVLDAQTQTVLRAFAPSAGLVWGPIAISVEPGRSVVLRASDHGRGWGQWLGLTAPRAGQAR